MPFHTILNPCTDKFQYMHAKYVLIIGWRCNTAKYFAACNVRALCVCDSQISTLYCWNTHTHACSSIQCMSQIDTHWNFSFLSNPSSFLAAKKKIPITLFNKTKEEKESIKNVKRNSNSNKPIIIWLTCQKNILTFPYTYKTITVFFLLSAFCCVYFDLCLDTVTRIEFSCDEHSGFSRCIIAVEKIVLSMMGEKKNQRKICSCLESWQEKWWWRWRRWLCDERNMR